MKMQKNALELKQLHGI